MKRLIVCIFMPIISCGIFEFGPCLLHYLEPCTKNTIQFYLFTSSRPQAAPILLDIDNPIVPKYFNFSHQMKLIVHGFAGNWDFNATKSIRNGENMALYWEIHLKKKKSFFFAAYLSKPDINLMVADWGHLAKYPCYPSAAFNTRQAGACIAQFLEKLEDNSAGKFNPSAVHAIGFSLGSHVVAFTSNLLENRTNESFQRITGLDPALPFFATTNDEWKLDPSDADFVDVC